LAAARGQPLLLLLMQGLSQMNLACPLQLLVPAAAAAAVLTLLLHRHHC
jgi:hypothetical protein